MLTADKGIYRMNLTQSLKHLQNALKAQEIYNMSIRKSIEQMNLVTEELRKMNVRLRMRVVKK